MRSRRGNGDAPVDPPVAGLVRCAQSADHSRRVSLVRAERAGVASPPSARLRLFFRGQPAAASLADTDCATPSPCPARLDIPCPGGARPLHPDHVCRRLEGLRSAELSRDPPMARLPDGTKRRASSLRANRHPRPCPPSLVQRRHCPALGSAATHRCLPDHPHPAHRLPDRRHPARRTQAAAKPGRTLSRLLSGGPDAHSVEIVPPMIRPAVVAGNQKVVITPSVTAWAPPSVKRPSMAEVLASAWLTERVLVRWYIYERPNSILGEYR